MSQPHARAETTTVSVVIPVYNEARHIEACLERVVGQTFPASAMEVLVVDGGSTDATRELVRAFAVKRAGMPPIRVVDNPRRQRAAAMNVGWRAAKGDVIVRIDARTRVEPDYIERCVATLKRTGAANVGGVVKPQGASSTQRAIGLAMGHPFGVGNAQFRLGAKSGEVDSVYLGCFRREVLERIGGFDDVTPILTEDSDVNHRIRLAGGRVYMDAGIPVEYAPRETLGGLWKLYFRYGGARAGFAIKHRALTSARQTAAPLFVLGALLGPLFAFLSPWFLAVWAGVLLFYALVALSVGVRLARSAGEPALALRVALAFPTMHFAWAFGFMRRLAEGRSPGKHWEQGI